MFRLLPFTNKLWPFGCAIALFSFVGLGHAADVRNWVVNKHQQFTQANSGAPIFKDVSTAYQFEASVNSSVTNVVTGLSVRLPGGSTQPGTAYSTNDGLGLGYTLNPGYATEAALDAAYPAGAYVLTINTVNDGVRTVTNTLPASVYPSTPRVSNYAAAQSINPAADFTLAWDAFTNGTAGDYIEVKVGVAGTGADAFSTAAPGQPGALTGLDGSVVIPANTLAAGTTYNCELWFYKIINYDAGSYPGAFGVTLFWKRTYFSLQTATPAAVATTPGVFSIANNAKLRDHGFPSVAFDGTNYLVGLQIPVSSNQTTVAAQFISQSGSLVGPQTLVSTNGDPTIVGFDGTNYTVFWDDGGSSYGQRLTKTGVKIGGVFPAGRTGLRAVAFDGVNYLVLSKDEATQNIYAQRVSPAGILAGTEFRIDSGNGGSPAVASDGTNYLVAWSSETAGGLFGRFVTAAGSLSGSQFVIEGSTNAAQRKVLFDGTRYVVAFTDGVEDSGTEDVFARVVSPAGTVSTNRITVSAAVGAQTAPSVAFDGTHYLFTWNDWQGGTNMSLKGKFVDMAGNPSSAEFTLMEPQGGKVARFAHVLFDGKQFFVVAEMGYYDTNTSSFTSSDLYGTFIAPLPKGTIPIAVTGDHEFGGDVAFDGTNYLVSMGGTPWASGEIAAQLISADGALLGARITTGRFGGFPKLAFDGTNYLMIWQDSASSPDDDIYGQFIGKSGALVGTPFAIGAAAGRQSLESFNHLVFDGSNYLAIWSDGRNGDTNNDIYAQRISPAGALVGAEIPIAIGAVNEREPSAAFDGTNYLVVWQSRRAGVTELWDTYGKFVSPAGVPGGAFLISQSPSRSYNPTSVAFDGTNYFVVWARDIGPGFPSPTEWDIYARIVTRSGTLAAGKEFAVTTAAGSQPFASVIYSGTGFLVSWLDESAGSSRSRFFGRLGVPLTAEFSLFGRQGTRFPVGGFLFDGSRLLAGATYVDDTFGNGDIYGLFVSPLDIPVPLAITEQPESQLVAVGRTIRLKVSVIGLEPITYQWRFNGTNIAGATDDELEIPNAQAGYSGDYTVVVGNYAGSVTSAAATVAVIGTPGVLTAPVNQTVARGGSATFTVAAGGVPPFRYQWRLNGVNLAGATNATLTVANVQSTNAGTYSVVVANLVGATVTSAKLLIGGGVSLLTDSFASRVITNSSVGEVKGNNTLATREAGEPSHAGRTGGRSVWFAWIAPGDGPVTIKTEGSGFDTLLAVYTGTDVASLTEVASNDDQGGFFTSVVRFYARSGVTYQIAVDGLGGAGGDIELEWEFDFGPDSIPKFLAQPQSQTVTNGANVLFAVTLTNAKPSDFTYQWYHNGQPLPGATSTNLFLTNVQPDQVGAYRFVLTKLDNGKIFLSDLATLELQKVEAGQPPDATRRSHDKFQDLFAAGSVSGASGFAALKKPKPAFVTVAAGALGTQ
ncbi:MAG: immunoglobulin domain-containing protein, partial [Verrucomicrobia bacterium]|nr:immunoglobulin domain-containing protein [Verrucomicrobiota bacterium]